MSLSVLGKRLSAIAFAFVIIGFLAGAQTASAHTATIDGGTHVDATPGQTIHVSVDSNLDSGAGVKGINWWFDGSAPTCADVTDFTNTNPYHVHQAVTTTFDVTAPTEPGTHSFYYQITYSDDCATLQGSDQDNGLTVTIPEPPPVPTCTDTQVLDTSNNTCVDLKPAHHRSSRGGTTNPNNGGGQVLGAETETPSEGEQCSTALLSTYMRMGQPNDLAEVAKLQVFLNGEMGSDLAVTGVFDAATDASVRAFQAKYASEVLAPWGITEPTGYVYKLTQWKINMINCAGLNAPKPQV
ncbi:MAG TPA: peptidoglycan-binding domain-containing protein [Candidatus Paceibacterota bacterium]|nr:peptidoglycan-binding domain-containing protein [Candidatus Paceibacterota bacterium]